MIYIVDCTISAQGGGVCVDKISFFYHFLTDWFNAVSILLSVQYHFIPLVEGEGITAV